jgi:hypothetical protein
MCELTERQTSHLLRVVPKQSGVHSFETLLHLLFWKEKRQPPESIRESIVRATTKCRYNPYSIKVTRPCFKEFVHIQPGNCDIL